MLSIVLGSRWVFNSYLLLFFSDFVLGQDSLLQTRPDLWTFQQLVGLCIWNSKCWPWWRWCDSLWWGKHIFKRFPSNQQLPSPVITILHTHFQLFQHSYSWSIIFFLLQKRWLSPSESNWTDQGHAVGKYWSQDLDQPGSVLKSKNTQPSWVPGGPSNRMALWDLVHGGWLAPSA